MARNVQIWTEDHRLLLDGPHATPEQLKHAMRTVQAGGLFGYRFLFPAMRVGRHEVYWHRPLVAYRDAEGEPVVLPDAPLGYLTAYDADKPQLDKPIELWPRIRQRPLALAALALHQPGTGRTALPVVRGVRKLLDAVAKHGGQPLPQSLARKLLVSDKHQTLDSWLESLPEAVAPGVRELIEPEDEPLTRRKSAKRAGVAHLPADRDAGVRGRYWKTIAALGEGPFLNKNNADCVPRPVTQKLLPYHGRHLDGARAITCSAYYDERDRGGAADRQGAGGRAAVPVADRLRLLLDGRLAEEPGRRGRARHRRRDSRPGSHAGGHHGRPLRHGLHGGPLRAELRRRRRPDRRVRGGRQPLGDGRADAGRADLPGDEPEGATRLRRLAGPPDRRGVSRRLPRAPAP